MSEIDEAVAFVHQTLSEAFLSVSPEDLSNAIVALSGWRFRLGQLLSETNYTYDLARSKRKQEEDRTFKELKSSSKMTNEECKITAEIETKEYMSQEIESMRFNLKVKHLWEDTKIAIDSIKYKINSLIKERTEIS